MAPRAIRASHRVRHCNLGGKAVKPTRLFAIRFLSLARQLAKWIYPVIPSHTLIGKNPDGSWRTAQAKDYPRRLSSALAFAVIDAATATWITPSAPIHLCACVCCCVRSNPCSTKPPKMLVLMLSTPHCPFANLACHGFLQLLSSTASPQQWRGPTSLGPLVRLAVP